VVIDELRRVQAAYGYLPRAALEELSRDARIPIDELYGVASFYPQFRFEPSRGPELQVCRDLPCRLAGAERLLADCLVAAAGGPVHVEAASCLGLCDIAPAVAADHAAFTRVDADAGAALVARLAAGRSPELFATPPLDPAALGIPGPADAYEFPVLRQLLAALPSARRAAVTALKSAGLRGLGGAGFPAGSKWEIVADAPGDRKHAVCNADESEPGTFKDRAILEGAPHLVLEGLLAGALVVGASEAIVYLRHEYRTALAALERTLRRLETQRLVGPGSPAGITARVFESPGGYICGEETALLEALEGRRAEPRNKPPFPGTHGLHGRPTLVNNVETLAFVPGILVHGPDWYRTVGANGASGRKLLALSGDVARPGVYAVPLGIAAGEMIERFGGGVAGGRRLKAFSPGGPSSGFLPATMADVPLDFAPLAKVGSMLGSGAVVVLAEGRCLLDAARAYVGFFEAESCGKCVPCRVGTQKLSARLGEWAAGRALPLADERATLDDLALTMGQASICGLGQVAALPITSALRHFPAEVEAHLVHGRCPEGVCQGSSR
jgi:NADH:ubiquinone oxidoreductase subunit F (NADH-binding)/NADH:ubiquinone oxidoreductase subunit E